MLPSSTSHLSLALFSLTPSRLLLLLMWRTFFYENGSLSRFRTLFTQTHKPHMVFGEQKSGRERHELLLQVVDLDACVSASTLCVFRSQMMMKTFSSEREGGEKVWH